MSVVRRLVALERRLRGETKSAPLELLGSVLALGLFVRATAHVYVALVARQTIAPEVSPELAGSDLTAASPVAALRGHRLDVVARAVTFAVGVGLWAFIQPFTGGSLLVQAFVVANLCVPLFDPVAFGVLRLRP